jgi:adenine-specific DNA-methyltransferase
MISATEGFVSPLEIGLRLSNSAMKSFQKPELGQVFTPLPVARLMAAMLRGHTTEVSLLDAGAGIGTLTAAAVELFCQRAPSVRPKTIHVTAYEIDPLLIEPLSVTLALCREQCSDVGIQFTAEIIPQDFLEEATEYLTEGLFSASLGPRFNCAILNPPYRKIRTGSRHRLLLSRIGVETSNLYTGFLAAAIRLLETGGEIVAITPRSFCNGPYFKSFRQEMLHSLALDHLHLFESRQDVFRDDDVLQETLVFHGIKAHGVEDRSDTPTVHISGVAALGYDVPYTAIVSPNDPDSFIHIPKEPQETGAAQPISALPNTLTELGLNVSTGRVVDFRARAYLRAEPEPGTVPLIYPAHLEHSRVTWPRARGKKPSSILAVKETETLLVPNAHYVLIRRFSTKEEKKRLVATVLEADSLPGEYIGIENHLNYFHCQGLGLEIELARGLAAFLNSTPADDYFRQFNGHTQVNATDLRSFRYPSLSQLTAIGEAVGKILIDQKALDELLQRIIYAPAH